MAGYMKTDEAQRNRLASMTPRDEDKVAAPCGPDPYAGRRGLREACLIRVDRIEPDADQPRKEFDAESLERLAESLKTRGQLQPIRVRWDEGRGVYVVVLGERRWRAAALAGLESVACVVVQGSPSPDELLEDQIVENALREDLKPVEQARSFRSLMGRLGLTQTQLAARLNISQTTVSQVLAMLSLPGPLQEAIDAGSLPRTVAYELSKVKDRGEQTELAERVMAGENVFEEIRSVSVKSPRAPKSKARRIEHRDPSGVVVVVTLPDGVGDDEALAALARASKAIRGFHNHRNRNVR